MPKYKLNLKVEVDCPSDPENSELTITLKEILKSLARTKNGGGYAVCSKDNPKKLTANMCVIKAEIDCESKVSIISRITRRLEWF